MIYVAATFVLVMVFLWLVPFDQWREYYPTLIWGALFGMVSDIFGVITDQWRYIEPNVDGLSFWSTLGIGPIESGLFVRLFPKANGAVVQGGYLVLWAGLNALTEWIFVLKGWIGYINWNPGRAFMYYILFFGLVWLQEYWYNGTSRIRNGQ